jgi:Phosphotransferase enzyme family
MTVSWQSLIPEHLHAAVHAGLSGVLGARQIESAEPVTGGVSGATTLRVHAGKRSFLLRVETVRSPFRNPHQYACMSIAAEAGLAPPLHYVDDQTGVAIMDFIEPRPLQSYPGGAVEVVRALGRLAANLQAAAAFPALLDYRVVVRRLTERLQTRFAPGLLDPHGAAFERICGSLSWDASGHVSSHNDPNPRNVLFDGERLWLIDWETAYRNDPLVDVAILVDNLAPTPELQDALIAAWQGRAPDAVVKQRLNAIRALTRLYYAGLLMATVTSATPIVGDLTALTQGEFRRRIGDGSLQAVAPETRIELVKMCLAGFLALQ